MPRPGQSNRGSRGLSNPAPEPVEQFQAQGMTPSRGNQVDDLENLASELKQQIEDLKGELLGLYRRLHDFSEFR